MLAHRFTKSTTTAPQLSAAIRLTPITPALNGPLGLLADFPRIGQLAGELAPGLRRFRFQAHHVYYNEDGDRIVIRAVYHHSRDIRPELFE